MKIQVKCKRHPEEKLGDDMEWIRNGSTNEWFLDPLVHCPVDSCPNELAYKVIFDDETVKEFQDE